MTSEIAARPLAPSDSLQAFPAFSPDGNRIAYSSDTGGTPHIYTMPVGGGDAVQITHGDGESQPSWSPDGKSIAYVPIRHGGIRMAPASGGEGTPLTPMGSRPAWSPDGSEIAFQTSEQIAYGWTMFDAQPHSTIQIVNVSTHRIVPLTREGQPPGAHGTPSWRADGRRLVFTSCEPERCGVYTIARNGSGVAELLTDSLKLTAPQFAHDGRSIDWVVVHYNHSELRSLPVDSNGQRVGHSARLRESSPGVMQDVVISRDGDRLAWTLAEERSELFSVRVNAAGTAAAPPVPLTRNPMVRHTFPAFSPDGSKIAYCAFAAGEDSGVWVADADGRNARALAVGPGLKQHTQWSRNGWDVFYAVWYGRGPAVFDSSLITGRSSVVTTLPNGSSAPVLSPDRTMVAFNRTIDGVMSVWVAAVNGGNARCLTADSDLARYPVWSPSGKQIAVQVRRRDGGSSVGVVAASGGSLRIVTSALDESWPYSWSPDEKQIAFAGRREGAWNIWTVPAAGGPPRRVTENDSTTVWFRSPAWSPSGDTIVYEAGNAKENVWISEPRIAQ